MNLKIGTMILALLLNAQSTTALAQGQVFPGYYQGANQGIGGGGWDQSREAKVAWTTRDCKPTVYLKGYSEEVYRHRIPDLHYVAALQGIFDTPTSCSCMSFTYQSFFIGPPVIKVDYSSWRTPRKSEYWKIHIIPEQCQIEDKGDGVHTVTHWFTPVDGRRPLIHRVAIVCPWDRAMEIWNLQFDRGQLASYDLNVRYVANEAEDPTDPLLSIY